MTAKNRTHTHLGNCQICGRQHAIDVQTGNIANHGYTIEWNSHNGTCTGSRKQPLQVSRFFTDRYIVELHSDAVAADASAANLKAGVVHPVRVAQFTDDGRIIRDNRFEQVNVRWEDANEYSRKHGVQVAIARAESNARWARSHAAQLAALADKLLGTALIEDQVEQRERVKAEKRGTRAAAAARKETLYRTSRAFERGYDEIEAIYLALPRVNGGARRVATEAQDATYGGVMYPHQWTAKRRAAVLSAWAGNQQVAEIVAKLDVIVAEHKAAKEGA